MTLAPQNDVCFNATHPDHIRIFQNKQGHLWNTSEDMAGYFGLNYEDAKIKQ